MDNIINVEYLVIIFKSSFFLYFIKEPVGMPYIKIKEDSKANNGGCLDEE